MSTDSDEGPSQIQSWHCACGGTGVGLDSLNLHTAEAHPATENGTIFVQWWEGTP